MESPLFLLDLLTGHVPPTIVSTRQDTDGFRTLSARSPPWRGEGVGSGARQSVKPPANRDAKCLHVGGTRVPQPGGPPKCACHESYPA